VNGATRYVFRGGITDNTGYTVDTYSNGLTGSLSISGATIVDATTYPDGPVGSVSLTWNGANYSGNCPIGSISLGVGGMSVEIIPADAAAYWIAGSLYVVSENDPTLFVNPGGQSFTLSLTADGKLQLSGTGVDGICGGGGIFLCTGNVPALPAQRDGRIVLSVTEAPANLPPAIKIGTEIWTYLGSEAEDSAPSETAAYYGHASAGGPGLQLLKIRASDGTVTLTDYSGQTPKMGSYDFDYHLFRTSQGQISTPLYGVNSGGNYDRWQWLSPANGRPGTVLIAANAGSAANAWGYIGTDAAGDHYSGYYNGQELIIGAASGRDGLSTVTLSGLSSGPAHTGTYYNGHFTMDSGPAITPGNTIGEQVAATGLTLSTTTHDLDVVGNLFSLGSLNTDANVVGLTLQFLDTGTVARLHSVLSRPQAEWIWNRATGSAVLTPIPMMKLGMGNTLTIFHPVDATYAPIILNPAGRSRFDGPIRIAPQGDLDMGEFTHGPGEP
jgi:hypothetical protein